jgi:hypothetical protein
VITEIVSNHRDLMHKIETEANIDQIQAVEGGAGGASSDRDHFKESPLIGKNERMKRFIV